MQIHPVLFPHQHTHSSFSEPVSEWITSHTVWQSPDNFILTQQNDNQSRKLILKTLSQTSGYTDLVDWAIRHLDPTKNMNRLLEKNIANIYLCIVHNIKRDSEALNRLSKRSCKISRKLILWGQISQLPPFPEVILRFSCRSPHQHKCRYLLWPGWSNAEFRTCTWP